MQTMCVVVGERSILRKSSSLTSFPFKCIVVQMWFVFCALKQSMSSTKVTLSAAMIHYMRLEIASNQAAAV